MLAPVERKEMEKATSCEYMQFFDQRLLITHMVPIKRVGWFKEMLIIND